MATKLTYKEQLLHPNWQRKRLETLEYANWECASCGTKETTLHVHHKQYFKGRMAWEYEGTDLEVLCEDCHKSEHADSELLKQILAPTDTATNVAMIGGFHKTCDWVDPELFESARQRDALAFAAGFVACVVYGLGDIEKMLRVGQFAADLLNENAESRLNFVHCRGNIFGEDL